MGAVSNCGGAAPVKNTCSGAGLLDNLWRIEIRSAGTFLGTVNGELTTATGFFTISCNFPTPTSDGVCLTSGGGIILPGQSFDLRGSVGRLPGAPNAAGHWLVAVYTSP